MKKFNLSFSLILLSIGTYAQTFPIVGTILSGTSKNILQLTDTLNNDSTRFELKNTGMASLQFFMANSATSTSASISVNVPVGQKIIATVAKLGGVATGVFMNVTNSATGELAKAGAYVVNISNSVGRGIPIIGDPC